MTCGEDQICTDENPGPSPERASIVVIFSDPDLADGAVWPDFCTGVDIALENVLHGIIVLRLEFANNVGALEFVSVFRNIGLSNRGFSARELRRLVTLGDFEAGFLHVAFDFDWIETALCLAALRFRTGRAVFRFGTWWLVDFRFVGWFVLGYIFGFILAWLWLVFRFAILAGFGIGSVFRFVFGFVLARLWLGGVFWIVIGKFAALVPSRSKCVVGGLRNGVRSDLWGTGGGMPGCVFAGGVGRSHRRSMR